MKNSTGPRPISEQLTSIMASYGERLAAVGERVAIDLDTCTKCGKCVEVCPTDALGLDTASGAPFVAHAGDCCVCFLCQDECPVAAIKVAAVLPTRGFRSIYDVYPEVLEGRPLGPDSEATS